MIAAGETWRPVQEGKSCQVMQGAQALDQGIPPREARESSQLVFEVSGANKAVKNTT